EKRSLLISTGEAPDIIPNTYAGQEQPFIPSGAILPISDHLDLLPNFSRLIDEWNLHEDIDTIKQKDGKFYIIPGLHQSYTPQYSLAIRTDIFEENDIPIPDSWDDLYKDLKTLKGKYP